MRKGDAEIMFQNWTSGGTDYGGCVGRLNFWDNVMSSTNTPPDMLRPVHRARRRPGQPDVPLKIGVFYPNSRTTLNQIIDGCSHTIMIAELQRLHNPGSCPVGQNPQYYGPCLTSSDGWALGGLSTLFDTAVDGEGGDTGSRAASTTSSSSTAGSQHPGGADFGAVDGSVHFMSENINSQTYAYLGSMADSVTVQFPD